MGNKVATKFSSEKTLKVLPVTPLQSGAGYTTCLWNEKEIKKMIYSKQIAPLYVGNTELIENR